MSTYHTYIDRTPYTYLIGWTKQDRWYYGVRFAKHCHPSELWIKYFTSSKHVKQFRIEHGEPDVVQIRKTFSKVEDAQLWEHKFLRRIKAVMRKDFLNKTDNKVIDPIFAGWSKGKILGPLDQSTKDKISKAKKGIPSCPIANIKRSITLKGVPHNTDWNNKVSVSMTGTGNHRYCTRVFTFKHDIYGTHTCTRNDLIKLFPDQKLNVGNLLKCNNHKGWSKI